MVCLCQSERLPSLFIFLSQTNSHFDSNTRPKKIHPALVEDNDKFTYSVNMAVPKYTLPKLPYAYDVRPNTLDPLSLAKYPPVN